MCQPNDKSADAEVSPKSVIRREESSRFLNTSATFKDVELGPSASQESTSSNASQSSSIRDWLSVKAAQNGKVISGVSLYGFCSVSMVLVNKSLASR